MMKILTVEVGGLVTQGQQVVGGRRRGRLGVAGDVQQSSDLLHLLLSRFHPPLCQSVKKYTVTALATSTEAEPLILCRSHQNIKALEKSL